MSCVDQDAINADFRGWMGFYLVTPCFLSLFYVMRVSGFCFGRKKFAHEMARSGRIFFQNFHRQTHKVLV